MGVFHEETANGSTVPSCHKGSGSKSTNTRDSSWRFSRWRISNKIRCITESIKGSSVTNGESCVAVAPRTERPERFRASNCSASRTSSVHCQEMGSRGSEENGNLRMKTLVTAIQKGGQGKTFATCHLAFDFHERGLRVAVADMDTQGNASYTLGAYKSGFTASQLISVDPSELRKHFHERKDDGLVLIEADAALANVEGNIKAGEAAVKLRANIDALGEFFDVLFIDTPPSLGVIMTAAIVVSDYMLSPLEMEAYSLQGIKKMVAVITNLRKQNPKLRFIGMVPNKVDRRKPRHVGNLTDIQTAYPQLVTPFSIGWRDSIAEALGEQMPVWKINKTAARIAVKEVRALAQYVFEKMEIA